MSDSLAATAGTLGTFRVGAVLGRSLSLLFAHIPFFVPLALVPGIPTLFLPLDPARMPPSAILTNSTVSLIVVFVLFPFVQATILHAAFQSMRGRPISFGESFSVSLTRFLPILGALFCVGIVVLLGFILLIIPALILLTRYYVVVPACVVDQTGPFDSMRRSAELTQGYRWRIFGMILLVGIVNVVLGYIVGGIGMMAGGFMGATILRFLVNGVVLAYSAVLAAVAYHDLRVAKEGVDTDRIAAVFD
ncbi:MAG TPA: glycerophosphoryl diester phosphodiesterase membrane domain-containing protein [Aliidongia sp.]|nr:glycerophosphoryl diester phosphodiesterase membrane domain-containing protein [Aliidongia sp.]